MKAEQQPYSVNALLELRDNNMLIVNAEYQRGVVWTLTQKRKLIDSVFRGYPLPIIYLHSIKKRVGAKSRDDLEIIDGQQRITAMHEFHQGAFSLFDPKTDTENTRFPIFIREQPCPWGGLRYNELPNELKEQFLNTPITVAEIETDNANEVRDLFVRLQGGSALNQQETRDAWPGGFNDFILGLGGKAGPSALPRPFLLQERAWHEAGIRQGKTRQLAAQITMLFLTRKDPKRKRLPDINAPAINDFYYDHLDFESNGEEAVRLRKVLTKIDRLFAGQNLPKLRGHDAIHAVLLVDALMEGYAPSWEDHFVTALVSFLLRLEQGKKIADDGGFAPFWTEYGQWTRTNSDRGENIERRDRFYVRNMVEAMQPLKPLDPTRIFGDLERRVLFLEQSGKCAVCGGTVAFDGMEVHHVERHSDGGATKLENGAIVHPECHPKSEVDTKAFAERWKTRRRPSDDPIPFNESGLDLNDIEL